MTTRLAIASLTMVWIAGSTPAGAAEGDEDNPTAGEAVSVTAEQVVQSFEDASFLPPQEYERRFEALLAERVFPLQLDTLPQHLDAEDDPRASIRADALMRTLEALDAISLRSKADGEILWGRIQGTKYERMGLAWIEGRLRELGFDDVVYDPFPCQYPQWRPTVDELVVTAAPGLSTPYRFERAITAFESGVTPTGGVEAEVVYVGEGTEAELRGRDLTGRIVLLRARSYPGAHLSSARGAFSRLALGRHGMPAGVVVWWDIPGNYAVAGRVGFSGGGDKAGAALPWISVGNQDGFYLRKLLDRADAEHPMRARLDVQGRMESGDARMSGNVYAMIPGQSGDYVLIPSHVDGYFNAIHDNGAGVAINLALAEYFLAKPAAERRHGLIFLFQGDHEVPGAGGTVVFARKHEKLMREHLLLVLQPEHPTSRAHLEEAGIFAWSNSSNPLMLFVTNRSPALIDVFKRAIALYNVPTADRLLVDPVGDTPAFYPPFLDLGEPISAGWTESATFYHSEASREMVDPVALEKIARAHAYVVEEVFRLDREDLARGGSPRPRTHFYYSDLLKMVYGNF